MNRKRVIGKTISMVLVCAMLGGSFAQYTFAEENPELDIVIEPEEIVLEDMPEAGLPAASMSENGQEGAGAEGQDVLAQADTENSAVSEQIDAGQQAEEQESLEDPFGVDLSIEEITVEDPVPELAAENSAVVAALLGEDDGASPIATISATGGSDFEIREVGDSVKILRVKEEAKTKNDLVIPDEINGKPVTEIAGSAFEGCTNFTGKLQLPSGLVTIGVNAFKGCAFKGNLTLPVSIKEIDSGAFEGCTGLTGGLDFSACSGLFIDKGAFSGCTGLNGALVLPADTSQIAADAFFDSIRMADGSIQLELQVGGNALSTPKILAGNSGLDLTGLVTWKSSDEKIVKVQAGAITAVKAGSATITATVAYNKKAVTRNVVVTDTGAPVVKSVGVSQASVLKPGTVDLSMSVMEGGMGIKKAEGFFCQTAAPAKKFSFAFDWSTSPKFTGTLSGEALRVSVPSTVEPGEYCLGGLTLTGMDGQVTTYTYDTTAKAWKNGSGNAVSISGTTALTVKDAFGAGEKKLYITNEAAINLALDGGTASAIVIQYDANNHTAKSGWFTKIKGKDVTLVLTNGAVEWCFYGKDIKTPKDIDCLVTVAKADTSGYGNASTSMAAQFVAKNGVLPGKATLRINASQMNNLYSQTKKLFLFSVNADTSLNKAGSLGYILSGGQYWYEFTMTDNTISKLLMSSADLSLAPEYKVTKLTLNKTKLGLAKGKTANLTVTVTPSNATNKKVKWTTSNKRIATVNAKGKVKAKRFGTVTIKATAQDGSNKSVTCKVTVGYKIKYKLNGGKNNKNNPEAYYKQTIKLKKPTRKGYTFQGWYTDSNFRHRIKKITTSYKINLTLYAKWKQN